MSKTHRNDHDSENGLAKVIIPSEYDLDQIVKDKREAVDSESFFVIAKDENFRIGLNVEIHFSNDATFSIEFLFRFFKEGSEVTPGQMKKVIMVQEDLSREGYSIFHEVGGWVILEKSIEREEIENECLSLFSYLSEHQILEHLDAGGVPNDQE